MIVAFTDHYGRLTGKRYDAEMFVERHGPATARMAAIIC